MTRFMGLIVILGTIIGGIINFPLSWALKLAQGGIAGEQFRSALGNVSWKSALGTVWDGQLSGVNSALGTADKAEFKIKPQNMMSGNPIVIFNASDRAYRVNGQMRPKYIRQFGFEGQLSGLRIPDIRLRGVQGHVEFSLSELRWNDQGCTAASGHAATNFLTQNAAIFRWRGPDLSGPVSCKDGQLHIDLSGQDGLQTISAQLVAGLNLSYQAKIRITTYDPNAAQFLPLLGFSKQGDAFVLTEQGRWRTGDLL